jgi:hypothetical protein
MTNIERVHFLKCLVNICNVHNILFLKMLFFRSFKKLTGLHEIYDV